jgi:zinc transport system substrate-binding protein
VQEAEGRVVAVWDADPRPSVDVTIDPHVWLDPTRFADMVGRIGTPLAREDAAEALRGHLRDLDARYRAGVEDCRSRTMVVTHEAFGYLAEAYGLDQIGLTGLTPEAEPTVERLGEAGAALAAGRARAVFYEADHEARRIAESVAADFGVPALPLGTLESRPPSGDYLSVMVDNLDSLRRGLGCA